MTQNLFKVEPQDNPIEESVTGFIRETQEGKPRYELIPVDPLKRVAMVFGQVVDQGKYPEENWRKGSPVKRYVASMARHMYGFMQEFQEGTEPTEDHLAKVVVNALMMMETMRQVELGNLPDDLLDWIPNNEH